MKVLWVCNLILPEIAEALNMPTIPKEGWVKGLYDAISNEIAKAKLDIEIAIAFPISKDYLMSNEECTRGFCMGSAGERQTKYYAFYEDISKEYKYDLDVEKEMSGILDDYMPDIVHCFGTEFPHTLATARAFKNSGRILTAIQGPCTIYAEKYYANMPQRVINRSTFRDVLKNDSIIRQKEKFVSRGVNEREAVSLSGHIAGRTDFDRELSSKWNKNAIYHHAGETLRSIFYYGAWDKNNADKYRIFVSQADYPLKGFHYLLTAVGELLSEQNSDSSAINDLDIHIYVAGQSIVAYDTLKNKLKISSYGKYLREMISKYNLEDRVHILGRLSAEDMKEQYLKCDTYVCCSACENSPNSLGEAMMLQVPIVTAEVGGIPSVFTLGEDGFSYKCDDNMSLEEVAENLKTVLLDRWNPLNAGEVERRRINSGVHAKKNHDPEANALEMINIYRDICK